MRGRLGISLPSYAGSSGIVPPSSGSTFARMATSGSGTLRLPNASAGGSAAARTSWRSRSAVPSGGSQPSRRAARS
eukprot:13954997-Alexandrium_andersonii.AAC.1